MNIKKICSILTIIFLMINIEGCGKAKVIDNSAVKNKINSYLDSAAKDNKFSGTILVSKNGKIISEKSYGFADNELEVKNTNLTRYRIGSMTNEFTATAILQIEQKGFLSLADNISKYIPNYPKGDKITIEELLSHTSGIPNYSNFDEYNLMARYNYSLDNIIKTFKNKPLEFEPGSKYKYSDSNYILLGYILEKVSGKKYSDYIYENIIKPLNLKNTGVILDNEIIKGRAKGIDVTEEGKEVNVKYQDPSRWYSATGMYSTVEDLYAFDRALYGDKLLNEKEKEKFFTAEKGKDYVNGWKLDSTSGHKNIRQNNIVPGFSGTMSRFVKDDCTIIILSNKTMEEEDIEKMNSNIAVCIF